MTTVRTQATAALVALLAAAGARSAPTAGAAGPVVNRPGAPRQPAAVGFQTVRRVPFRAQAVAAGAGQVAVVGTRATAPGAEGTVVAEVLRKGAWTSTTFAAKARTTQVAVSGGTIWLLTTGTTSTLWRSQGTTFVRVPMPAMPTGVSSFTPQSLAAGPTSIALWGRSHGATLPATGTTAVLANGAWRATRQNPTTLGSPSAAGLLAIAQGRVLADTSFPGGRPSGTLYDYSATPAKALGSTMTTAPSGEVWGTKALVAPYASQVTAWGYHRSFDQGDPAVWADRGSCLLLVSGVMTWCAAPAWQVTAATRLADGRQVIGGQDTYARTDRATGTGRDLVQGGYALVAAPGARPSGMAGDPGAAVLGMAADPSGTTVWSVVTDANGATAVQRAILPAMVRPRTTPGR